MLTQALITEFVKATKDEKRQKTETTVYGTTVVDNGITYVKIDGSDLLTPVIKTADTKHGERVMVLIKNHTATITGNISSPAARTDDVQNIAGAASEYEVIKKTVDGLVMDVKECCNDIDNLQKSELTLATSVSDLSKTVSANDLKVTNFENKLLDHDKTLVELEKTTLSLKLTNDSQSKSIGNIETKLSEHDTSITTINETLENLGGSIDTINTTLSEHGDSITSINKQLESIAADITSIISRLEALENPTE